MSALAKFEEKFISLRALVFATPVLLALYVLTAKELKFPSDDLNVYRRAADFIFSGVSPYSSAFTVDAFANLPWVYTPFAALLMSPLHWIPEAAVSIIWLLIVWVLPMIALTALAYRKFFDRQTFSRGERLAAFTIFLMLGFAAGPVVEIFIHGQIGLVLAAMVLWDLAAPDSWLRIQRFKLPRGVLAGIAGAIKIVPLIAIPYWLVTKQWRAAVTALGTVIVAWGAAFAVLPSASIDYFLNAKFLSTNSLENVTFSDNQSLAALVMRVTGEHPLPTMVWASLGVAAVLFGLGFARATHRNGDLLSAGIIVGLTSVLASPVSWIHHATWIVAIPGAILAGAAIRSSGRLTSHAWAWVIAVIAIVIPSVRLGYSPLFLLGISEQYNILSVLMIVWLWHRSRSARRLETA